MAIPDYQSIMLPLLRLAGGGQEHFFRDAVEVLAQPVPVDAGRTTAAAAKPDTAAVR
jgi:hypothetical protein